MIFFIFRFIDIDTESGAIRAIQELDGYALKGSIIKVSISRSIDKINQKNSEIERRLLDSNYDFSYMSMRDRKCAVYTDPYNLIIVF